MNKITVAAAFAAMPGLVFANVAESKQVEELLVSASRTEMPLRQIGSSVSVITAAEIEAKGFISTADILRTLPGIAVSTSGGLGKQTALRVRGEESFRTLVLVDGVDYSDPTTTQVQTQIEHLQPADIERIEVLRGPQGMMYGADAGGVINIITKKGKGAPQGSVQVEHGRYGTQKLVGAVRGKVGALDYAFSGANLETDGFNARAADSTLKDDDGYENNSYNASLGWQLNQQFRGEFVARRVDAESEFDGCFLSGVGSSHDCKSNYDQRSHKLSAIWSNGNHTQRLTYHKTDIERENFAIGATSFLADGGVKEVQYFGSSKLSTALNLIYGVDYEEQLISSRDPDLERDQTGAYVELQGTFHDRYFLTAGSRLDDNEDFGEHWSHRLTGAYLIPTESGDEIKLRASYGSGFRAPSLSEIAYNESPAAFAPAKGTELSEETSKGFDIGFEYHGANGAFVDVTYFDQRIEDEIFFDLSGFSGYLQTSGDTESKGWEISAELPLEERTTLIANYTYNDTKDSSGEQRVRRPKRITNLGFRHEIPQIRATLNANMRFVRDAVDQIFGLGRVELDDYQVLDMNLSWQATENLEIYIRGENVLGREYQEITGFNTAGAATYGGFRFRF